MINCEEVENWQLMPVDNFSSNSNEKGKLKRIIKQGRFEERSSNKIHSFFFSFWNDLIRERLDSPIVYNVLATKK